MPIIPQEEKEKKTYLHMWPCYEVRFPCQHRDSASDILHINVYNHIYNSKVKYFLKEKSLGKYSVNENKCTTMVQTAYVFLLLS